MINEQIIRLQAQKIETNFRNILREYFQNRFLAAFYRKKESSHFLFKGGTALRIVFNSPRFSEDLDFSGLKNSVDFENLLEDVLLELSLENFQVDLIESKPTSGGHLAIIKINIFKEKIELCQQVSFRPKKSLIPQIAAVSPVNTPSYNLYLLEKKSLVREKLEALLTRQKPRDFFDLYFILRKEELRQALKLDKEQRKMIFACLEKQDKRKLNLELKNLLPKSFWPIILDLPKVLKSELGGIST